MNQNKYLAFVSCNGKTASSLNTAEDLINFIDFSYCHNATIEVYNLANGKPEKLQIREKCHNLDDKQYIAFVDADGNVVFDGHGEEPLELRRALL